MDHCFGDPTPVFEFVKEPRTSRIVANRHNESERAEFVPFNGLRGSNQNSCQFVSFGLIVDDERRFESGSPRGFDGDSRVTPSPVNDQRLLRIHTHGDSSDITLG